MNINRRTLLIGGGAGIGLVVVYSLAPAHLDSPLALAPGEQGFGGFIKIANSGRITVAVPQIETGQGAWTALPQIVADELGAAWDMVGAEPTPVDADYANPLAGEAGWAADLGPLRAHRIGGAAMQITAGATSVRAFEQPLRQAAAIARAMLVGAAADRWGIAPRDCDTADGFVISRERTFSFAELAEEAADRNPPRRAPLKTSTRSRLAGLALPRIDGPAKSDGSLRFAADIRLPDMVYASARIAPPGGRLSGFSRDALDAIPGVRHVASRDAWVAVVADSWWSAEKALRAAAPTFKAPKSAGELRGRFDNALAHGPSKRIFRRGDYGGAIAGSRPLAATYYVAPSLHLPLEPQCATARVSNGSRELWIATQAPGLARSGAGKDPALYPMPVGEPAGRALETDTGPIAIELAQAIGRPVQLLLPASASQNCDRISPGALMRMNALPGADGITAAWAMKIATVDGMAAALARMSGGSASEQPLLHPTAPPYGIPNVRIDSSPVALPFFAGYMRGSPERELAFATESFVDELAHAAGLEPLTLRMALLGENGRLARCLQGATRRAQWDGGGRGGTMGVAGCSAFGSHIGLVARATIDENQQIKVHRLVAAVDCGRAVNIGLVAQQIESSLIWAIAQANSPSPEWIAGMPRARPLRELGLPRLSETPEIEIEIIPSSDPPGGINGLGATVLAPAVANAIFAGTGRRLRSLPFDLASGA